jgi:CelD/BcsL family acetyltransferase involved in cellulose biosynthesis
VRLVLLREIPRDENLRQQWDGLVQSVDQPQVFYSWEWASAVVRAYHASLHPLVFLAYDEQDSLCGVAALAANLEQTEVTFLCATTGDYCDFLSSPQDKPAFVSAVLAELRKLSMGEITLTNLPADSTTVRALRQSCKKQGYHLFARTAYVCSQVLLAALERRPGNAQAVLPRKKMLRRFLNAMGREAPVRLDHTSSWAEIEASMPEFFQSHVARFLNHGMISNAARPERQLFLRELAKLLCERGWMAFTRMMSGQKVFAWNYGFQFQNTWFWYQPTFDSALEKYSPGFCLLAKLIEEAADNPMLRVVDLGLGAEEYKERFSNRKRETLRVTLKSSAGKHYREVVRHGSASMVRAVPRADAALRGVRQRWREFGQAGKTDGTSSSTEGPLHEKFLARREFALYEWRGPAMKEPDGGSVQTIDLNSLAAAAMRYVDDPDTLHYLLRSAARLRTRKGEGFMVVDRDALTQHFVWATGFDEFLLSHLKAKVPAPAPECVMLFDGWTPGAGRSRGGHALAMSLVARRIQEQGKHPWIVADSADLPAARELELAGFQRRYCLTCRRILWWQRIKGDPQTVVHARAAEVSAHV